MAVSSRFQLRGAVFAAALALVACGDDGTTDAADAGAGGSNGNGGNADNNGNGSANNGSGSSDMDAGPAVADLADNVAGQACESAADCAGTGTVCADSVGGFDLGGMSIGGTPAPDGYCTGPCIDDSSCGAGGVCAGAVAGFAMGSCQAACVMDEDCREGQRCNAGFSLPDGGVDFGDAGIPGGGIPGGGIPDQPSTCLPKPETVQIADGKVGQPCLAASDCGGGECLTTIGGLEIPIVGPVGTADAPGGYCGGPCTEDAQCGAGGVCVTISLPIGPSVGACYLACNDDDDCAREGYVCAAPIADSGNLPGVGMGAGNLPDVCFPGSANDADAGM